MNKKNIQGYFSLRKENELSFACKRENNRPSEERNGVKRPGLSFFVTLGHLCTIVWLPIHSAIYLFVCSAISLSSQSSVHSSIHPDMHSLVH